MLHRLAVDHGYVAMIFQASLFRTFNRLFTDHVYKVAKQYEVCLHWIILLVQFINLVSQLVCDKNCNVLRHHGRNVIRIMTRVVIIINITINKIYYNHDVTNVKVNFIALSKIYI